MDYEHIEKLLSTNLRLVGLESNQYERILSGFRDYSRYSGKAVYVWENQKGLYRMDSSHIKIPNTHTPVQILQHIEKVRYFGIYLLKGFNQFLGEAQTQILLRNMSRSINAYKLAIMIDEKLVIPQAMIGQILLTKPRMEPVLAKTA